MPEIPVFRIHTERLKKDRFEAVARHLGLRGDLVATEEALFMRDKERALAYAMPGSRFAGLLFFTDQSQSIADPVKRAPATEQAEKWTSDFLKRFQLAPRDLANEKINVSFKLRGLQTNSAVEDTRGVRQVPLATEVVSDLRVNTYHVTGPRAKLRLVFKSARAPFWLHRALWEKLEVFETRAMVTEDELFRRLSESMERRGQAQRNWQMLNNRLAYFATEFVGGPDLLLPYYFVEIELRDPKDRERARQGPRRMIQIPACR